MIQKLIGSIREYKKTSIETPLLVVGEVTMEVFIPLIMANLIDFGIDKGDMTYILKTGAALFVFALIALFFGALAGKTAAIASSGFAKNLREDMYYNVQNFSFANIDKFSTASIITRLTTDVTNVQMAYQMLVRMVMRSPIMILFALIAAFTIDAKLSLIYLSIIPVLGLGLFLIIRKAHPVFERVFKTYDHLNNIVQENLHGIRVVKAYVREDFENKKFDNVSTQLYNQFTLAERTITLNMPLMQFSLYACTILIAWFGARAIIASGNNPVLGLSTGELMSLITYSTQILMNLMMLSMVLVMITISRASAERIVEILDEKSDLTNPADPIHEVPNGSIEFKNVSFSYSKTAEVMCLQGINLTIRSGETIGILGVTGSSKSTLVQLIPRLYDATQGQVLVGGIDVREYDLESLRNQVAMVLQKNILFSGTIKENLRWGDENASDADLVHACQLAQAHDFIMSFPQGYDTYIEQGGANVSGGQKQRLCIARALLKHPKILILDDSTSAVDTKTDALIRQAFRAEIPHTTKLIIAQRVASVQDADKIVVLENGQIITAGPHAELLQTSPVYREVYESQIKGGSNHE
ncbi:MAG TPA: ABC transporter ATP-binding protein [Bellilinea sp.]|jgi:ATP-binding cassette subfamily B multidrug efflux pump|nr:ABC transporter ATP-binding protein [Bellilinea sp.]